MLTVTESAKRLLKETLINHTDDPEFGLRLVFGPSGQQGVAVDREVEGDQVVEHDGLKVLLVGRELAIIVEGLTIDVQDTFEGPQLAILKG